MPMNDHLNIFNRNYYTNKIYYLENLKKHFKNPLEILNNVKDNFNNSHILFNGTHQKSYLSFLTTLGKLNVKYFELILLLISHISFAKPIELIKKDLGNSYHIIFNKSTIRYNITFHCLAKQFFCETTINIFKLDNCSNIIDDFNCKLSIKVDLTNSEPVLFNVSK